MPFVSLKEGIIRVGEVFEAFIDFWPPVSWGAKKNSLSLRKKLSAVTDMA
jgi:hypothetical protein